MFSVLLSEGGEEEEAHLEVLGIHLNEVSTLLIAVLVLLLLIAVLRMAVFVWEVKFLPESGIIILLGCIIALITLGIGINSTSVLTFNPEIFFAGFSIDTAAFFGNLNLILAYALVGTLINTIVMGRSLLMSVVGVVLYLLSPLFTIHVTIMDMLTFGALISAVDPVAVIAIFDAVHVNPTLHILVFDSGESVLNDAVSIVLYTVFNALRTIPALNWTIPGLALSKFFWVSAIGTIIGCGLGLLCALITRFNADPTEFSVHSICYAVPLKDRTNLIPFLPRKPDEEMKHHRYLLEPLLVAIFGALSFVLAEVFLASGIVATLFCGIMVALYVAPNLNHKSLVATRYMSKVLAGATESMVFLYLGMSTVFHIYEGGGAIWDPALICFTIVLMLISRFILTFAITFIANRNRGLHPVSFRDQFVIAYGGLRGAIAFALAFILNEHLETRDHIIMATLVVIWFTVFVMGTTIKPILNILHVQRAAADPTPSEVVLTRAVPYVVDGMKLIAGNRSTTIGQDFFKAVDAMIRWCVVRKANRHERELYHSLKALRKMQMKQELEADDDEPGKKDWGFHSGSHVNLASGLPHVNLASGLSASPRVGSDPHVSGSESEEEELNNSLMSLLDSGRYRSHQLFVDEPVYPSRVITRRGGGGGTGDVDRPGSPRRR